MCPSEAVSPLKGFQASVANQTYPQYTSTSLALLGTKQPKRPQVPPTSPTFHPSMPMGSDNGFYPFNPPTRIPVDTAWVPTDPNQTQRNPWGDLSYAEIIAQAIESSSKKRMVLSEIYKYMQKNFAYFGERNDKKSSIGWKNSVRHNLSLHNEFIRVKNDIPGLPSFWMVRPDRKTSRRGSGRKRSGTGSHSCRETVLVSSAAENGGKIRLRKNMRDSATNTSPPPSRIVPQAGLTNDKLSTVVSTNTIQDPLAIKSKALFLQQCGYTPASTCKLETGNERVVLCDLCRCVINNFH